MPSAVRIAQPRSPLSLILHRSAAGLLLMSAGLVGFLGGEASAGSLFTPTRVIVGTPFDPFVRANPVGIVAADFNGDGVLDLATANISGANVAVALGTGDGQYPNLAPTKFPTNPRPRSIAAGDLNGDGRMDLIVESSRVNAVTIYLGDGNGNFAPGPGGDYPAGSAPTSVVVGDLNGDGRQDVVVANFNSNTISTWLGNGDGTLSPRQDFPTGVGPNTVALGDLNADGRLDAVTANFNSAGTVSVLLGNGDGTFGPRTDLVAASGSFSVAIGDLNHDGVPDLAVADGGFNITGNLVSVFLGNGNGSFGPKRDFTTVNDPIVIRIADFNGDGHPDLVTGSQDYHSLFIHRGNGDGTFQTPRTIFYAGNTYSVVAADLDSDGRMDLATADFNIDTITVLFGNKFGNPGSPFPFAVGSGDVMRVTSGDLNSDGLADIAYSGYSNNTVSVLLQAPGGAFLPYPSLTTGAAPRSVAIADLNADGKGDLAVANYGDNTVSIFLGNGDGSFGPRNDYKTAAGPTALAIGDLNGDRKLDIAVTGTDDNKVTVLLGNGKGKFGNRSDYRANFAPKAIQLGDLNGDGQLDAAVLAQDGFLPGNGLVSIMLGRNNGTLADKVDYPTGNSFPQDLAMGDLNHDGRPDLVVGAGGVTTLLGNGDGSLGAPAGPFFPQVGATFIDLGDFDRDGNLDVAAAYGRVGVLLGAGDGTFPRAQLGFVAGGWDVVVMDYRGDGLPDILTGDADPLLVYGYPAVSILENQLGPMFSAMSASPSLTRSGPTKSAPGASLAPNPFNPETTLHFSTSRSGPVSVRLFDINGRRVRTLMEQPSLAPGAHALRIDGRDEAGRKLASGVYFYRIESGEGSTVGRFTILK